MTAPLSLVRPKRPVLRYHGGKWLLAPWIISQMPPHRSYIEPYGGAASVLMRKPRCYAEVYNELDGEIVSLFRILRDPDLARELERILRLTPFARDEFELSYQKADSEMENARRLVVRCFMGFGSTAHNQRWRTGFRADSNRAGTTPAHDWANYTDALCWMTKRLAGVVIEHRPALQVIREFDAEDALFYVDPPYEHATRTKWKDRAYVHEMKDDDHRGLADVLRSAKGMVMVSGYNSELYSELYGDWDRVECANFAGSANGRSRRVESLWLSPKAIANRNQPDLFESGR